MKDEYYATREARIDTLAGPNSYYELLLRLRNEYDGHRWERFADWCESEHGFRPNYDEAGGITGEPEVTDAQKYTLCLLKYGG